MNSNELACRLLEILNLNENIDGMIRREGGAPYSDKNYREDISILTASCHRILNKGGK